MKSKFTHPLLLDEPASDFPDLAIYCTHCGHGSYMEMLSIARARTNIFCDMAAWLSWLYSGEVLKFYQTWRYITNMLGAHRMLFASDQTGPKYTPELKKGKFGIPEPAHPVWAGPEDIDLILVPGLAFDRHGHRCVRQHLRICCCGSRR